MMKRNKAFSILVLSTLGLVACNNSPIDENQSNESSLEESMISSNQGQAKAIVVYFSATQHTEKVAQTIANHIESPLYELEPVNPYTSSDLNYSSSTSRVSTEHNDPNRHVELKTTSFEGFKEADCVFLGAPVWWGELSWVIDDFVKLNDFSSKAIIPFGTSASSNFSVSKLETMTTNATWLTPQRFSSNVGKENVISWLDGLSLNI